MLIVLPPSETKRPPPVEGSPLDLNQLSFPSLTAMRERVMDALVATSQRPDALRRLFVGPSLAGEVARNEHLRDLPTRSAVDTYARPPYEGLDAGSWSSHAEKRAARQVIVVSALWGAVRLADRIPPYRLTSARSWSAWTAWSPPGESSCRPSSPMRPRGADRSRSALEGLPGCRSPDGPRRPDRDLADQTVARRPGSTSAMSSRNGFGARRQATSYVGGKIRRMPWTRRPPRRTVVARGRSTRADVTEPGQPRDPSDA